MKQLLETGLEEVKGKTYIMDIPIEEFGTVGELTEFVERADRMGVGTVLHLERSNLHQGVLVQAFDKKTCTYKDSLFG